jgi:hypothetical protein
MTKPRNDAAAASGSDDFVQAMNLVAQGTSSLAAAAPTLSPEPLASEPTATPLVEQPADKQQQMERKEPAAAIPSPTGERTDYASTFLTPVRGRKPKAIYVTEDMHTALVTITQATPDGVGLSDLLIHIVNHHFEIYGPQIRQFLTTQERAKKTKLPY